MVLIDPGWRKSLCDDGERAGCVQLAWRRKVRRRAEGVAHDEAAHFGQPGALGPQRRDVAIASRGHARFIYYRSARRRRRRRRGCFARDAAARAGGGGARGALRGRQRVVEGHASGSRVAQRDHRRSPSLTRAERGRRGRRTPSNSGARTDRGTCGDVAVQLKGTGLRRDGKCPRKRTRPTTKPSSSSASRIERGCLSAALRGREVDLWDCPVLVDACAVSPDGLILDDDVLNAYSIYFIR